MPPWAHAGVVLLLVILATAVVSYHDEIYLFVMRANEQIKPLGGRFLKRGNSWSVVWSVPIVVILAAVLFVDEFLSGPAPTELELVLQNWQNQAPAPYLATLLFICGQLLIIVVRLTAPARADNRARTVVGVSWLLVGVAGAWLIVSVMPIDSLSIEQQSLAT